MIHNIPNINPKTIANHTRFILNNELSLSNIELVKTKVVKTKRGKDLDFVELKSTEQHSTVLKNKHLLRNAIRAGPNTPPLYIHPARSNEHMRTNTNMKKLITMIPGASERVAISNQGYIIERKPYQLQNITLSSSEQSTTITQLQISTRQTTTAI